MKRILLAIAALAFLGASTTSTTASPQTQGQQPERITAAGIVTNPNTGDPVPNATVVFTLEERAVFGPPLHTATTGPDGKFTVKDVIPGRYRVAPIAPGFTTPRGFHENDLTRSSGQLVTVAAGTVIRLPLIRTASIGGRVLDERGMPLTPVSISIVEKGYQSTGVPILQQFPGAVTVTDDRSEFETSGLRPGEYYVRVARSVTRGRGNTIQGPLGAPVAYYPGVLTFDQAVPLTVSEGQHLAGIDIKIPATRLFSVRMKLVSASTITSADFTLKRGLEQVSVPPEDAGGGVYVLSQIGKGEYDVDIALPTNVAGMFPRVHRLHVVVVDRDIDLGAVNVDSQVSISGRVTIPQGIPLPTGISLHGIGNGVFSISVPLQPDGTFLLENVSLGRYTVTTTLIRRDSYVQSLRYGAQEVPGALSIDGTPPGPLEVAVGRTPAKVEGTIRDARNEPLAFYRVILVPELARRSNPDLFTLATADEAGRFSIPNVAPGSYSVVAVRYTPPFAYLNPDYVDSFLKRSVPLNARAGLTSAVELRPADAPE